MISNFQTDNLILVYFPPFAGGKFIMNCLSLSRRAVPQDTQSAKYLADHPTDYHYRLRAILNTLPPTDQFAQWRAWEFGDKEFYGGLVDNLLPCWKNNQPTAGDDLIQELIEKNLSFFMTRHGGTADLVHQALEAWPNAKIIMLTNYNKFWNIAFNLKNKNQTTPNIIDHAGNDCESKYNSIKGNEWPDWNLFEKCNYDIDKTAQYVTIQDNIQQEIKQYYKWHLIKNPIFCFDVDNTYFFKKEFFKKMKELYIWLGYEDYNQDLVEEYYSKYMSLHVNTI